MLSLTGIAFEHDGGAIMSETYCNITINSSFFGTNEAIDKGGAIYVRRRCQIKIENSIFKLNKAMNSGGSILIQHSLAIIQTCDFYMESAMLGYGGAISAENVASVGVSRCSFHNCTASNGGSLSFTSESKLVIEHSTLLHSFAIKNGGGAYILQKSFVLGINVTVSAGKSVLVLVYLYLTQVAFS